MNDSISNPPLLVTMLKNLLEPITHFQPKEMKDNIAEAVELTNAVGIKLDQMKNASAKKIRNFFNLWISQAGLEDLASQISSSHNLEHYLLKNPELLTQEFLDLRASIYESESIAELKHALHTMDIERLRVLLSGEFGDFGLEIRSRWFTKEICKKIQYLYPSLHFAALFSDQRWNAFSFNAVFPIAILDKPYMQMIFQYGVCETTSFEKNLLRKLFRQEHQEVIELLYGRKIDIILSTYYMLRHAVAENLESNIQFLLTIGENRYRMRNIMLEKSYKTFELLLRNSIDVQDKYRVIMLLNEGYPTDRVNIVLAQLALDADIGWISSEKIYYHLEEAGTFGFKFKNYFKMCLEQVEWMKNTVVFKNITLLHALDIDVGYLAQFSGLKENIRNLLAQCREKQLVDYYYSALEEQFDTAIAVQDILLRAAEFIQNASGLFVSLIIDKIMSYLSLKDLRYFVLPVDPII